MAVFAGGGLGALARALLVDAHPPAPGTWPWVTFGVNLAGAFLLGVVLTRLRPAVGGGPSRGHLLLGTGFCGALTTFSTMQLELLQMLDAGEVGLAAGYASAALTAGFLAVAAGVRVAGRGRAAA